MSFMTLLCFYFQTACAKLAADAGTCIALAFWCKFLIVGKKKREEWDQIKNRKKSDLNSENIKNHVCSGLASIRKFPAL